MTARLFKNVMIFDGSGRAPFPGEVLVRGNRIGKVAEGVSQIGRDDAAEVIDGQGMTLMPGMTEGHCHISFTGVASPAELGELPPEEHTLATMHNAKLLFDHGFTSVYCAASAKPRLDVVIRNEVNAGRIPGPRIRACGHHIGTTADLNDSKLWWKRYQTPGIDLFADGPEQLRALVREEIRRGVETIKVFASSGRGFNGRTVRNIATDELAAIVAATRVAESVTLTRTAGPLNVTGSGPTYTFMFP